jgi:thiol:disulfide interchange protein DsbC
VNPMKSLRSLPVCLCLTVQAALAAADSPSTASAPSQPASAPAPAVTALAAEVAPALKEKIRAALKERVPKLVVLEVHDTPLSGLYEIVSPDGISYSDVAANYVLMGQLVDTRRQRNLTQERWTAFNNVDFNSLPFSLAIKSTRGNGSRQIAVFADPKCPYCQELEGELAKLDDVTVYTFLYPLESVHPGATVKAHQIWCASDRESAWNNWMRKQEAPPERECAEDPIKQLAALGEKLHIDTTPTIIFHSGRRSLGLPPTKQFEHLLDTEANVPAASATANTTHPDS